MQKQENGLCKNKLSNSSAGISIEAGDRRIPLSTFHI
jgi:hypothetical protein